MDQKTAQQLNDKTRIAAYKIMKALSVFDNEPPEVRHQAEQIVMYRLQQMRTGHGDIVDGDHLVKLVPEPEEPAPAPPETDSP